MTKARPQTLSLNGGEADREAVARSDMESYANKSQLFENLLPALKGGAFRAPGSRFIGTTWRGPGGDLAEDLAAKLLSWRFSRLQSFVLQLCATAMRIVYDIGYVQVGGSKASFAAHWTDTSTGGATFVEGVPAGPDQPGDGGYTPPPDTGGGVDGGGHYRDPNQPLPNVN